MRPKMILGFVMAALAGAVSGPASVGNFMGLRPKPLAPPRRRNRAQARTGNRSGKNYGTHYQRFVDRKSPVWQAAEAKRQRKGAKRVRDAMLCAGGQLRQLARLQQLGAVRAHHTNFMFSSVDKDAVPNDGRRYYVVDQESYMRQMGNAQKMAAEMYDSLVAQGYSTLDGETYTKP